MVYQSFLGVGLHNPIPGNLYAWIYLTEHGTSRELRIGLQGQHSPPYSIDVVVLPRLTQYTYLSGRNVKTATYHQNFTARSSEPSDSIGVICIAGHVSAVLFSSFFTLQIACRSVCLLQRRCPMLTSGSTVLCGFQ